MDFIDYTNLWAEENSQPERNQKSVSKSSLGNITLIQYQNDKESERKVQRNQRANEVLSQIRRTVPSKINSKDWKHGKI